MTSPVVEGIARATAHWGTVAALASLFWAGHAAAADTIETWDAGATDLELYAGAEGLGLPAGQTSIFTEAVVGYGVVDRVSFYVRGAGTADERLGNPSGEAGAGIFGTPLDSDHVDLDLIFDIGWSPEALTLAPGFELNLDREPDLAAYGLYLRGEEALTSRTREEPTDAEAAPSADAEAPGHHQLAPETTLTLGVYWALHEGHQLLFEADGTLLNHDPVGDEHLLDFGAVALGYNVLVHEAVELIHHVFVDVPAYEADPIAAGVSVGIIATVPTPGEESPREERAARRASSRLARW